MTGDPSVPLATKASLVESEPPLLAVSGLTVAFELDDRVVEIVSDLTYSIDAGESLAILRRVGVGEQDQFAAVMGLLLPSERVTGGSVTSCPSLASRSPGDLDYRTPRGTGIPRCPHGSQRGLHGGLADR